jgi:hypothetical protein
MDTESFGFLSFSILTYWFWKTTKKRKMSQLDHLIPPEVRNDELAGWLTRLATRNDVKTILEVGSSSGEGSTAALAEGLKRNGAANLYCVEFSEVRFKALESRYINNAQVHCYRGCSVRRDGFLTPAQVADFYQNHKTNLNRYPLPRVLGWLEQDLDYLDMHVVPMDVIMSIRAAAKVEFFDLAFLDGSAFTGMADLMQVFGASLIVLDDICDIKNHGAYHFLRRADAIRYNLIWENWNVRNGFAVFERKV